MVDPVDPGLVLHQEHATVVNEWVPVTRVHISKRIVTEIQTIEVEVRREELVVTHEPIVDGLPFAPGAAPVPVAPRIYELRAEVPSVRLTMQPVERVAVTTHVVEGSRELTVELSSEHLRLDGLDPTAPPDARAPTITSNPT